MASQWHFVQCTIYSTLFESMEANWSSKAHAVSSIISVPVIIMILYIFSCLNNFLKSLYFLLFSRKRNFCLNCKLLKGDFLVIIWNNNPPIGNCDDINRSQYSFTAAKHVKQDKFTWKIHDVILQKWTTLNISSTDCLIKK